MNRHPRRLSPEERAARQAWRQDVPPGCDPHHIILSQRLRAQGFADWVYDLRNRLIIDRRTHALHHSANGPRIPRSMLPDSVFDFAAELDSIKGTDYFMHLLLESYPDEEVAA